MSNPKRWFSPIGALVLAGSLAMPAGGCMVMSPQLPPTDYAALEKVKDRRQREQAFQENTIVKHEEPQGTRYTKGTDPYATKRSWQSLDAILRSDENSAAALPTRKLRLARLFTALTLAAGVLTVAGVAASAREGLDLKKLNGTGGLLLGSGILTVAFGLTGGIMYGKSKADYKRAVDIYNDSLAMRLGINDPNGNYIPPAGVLVDEDGFVVLDEGAEQLEKAEDAAQEEPQEVGPAPPPTQPSAETPAAEPTSPEPAPPVTSPAPPPREPEPSPVVPPPTEAAPTVPAPPGGGGTAAPPLSLSPRG